MIRSVLRSFATSHGSNATRSVNGVYQPGVAACAPQKGMTSVAQCTRTPCLCQANDAAAQVLAKHKAIKWTPQLYREQSQKNVLMTWGATDPMLKSVSRMCSLSLQCTTKLQCKLPNWNTVFNGFFSLSLHVGHVSQSL
jgi:hypothetical protein